MGLDLLYPEVWIQVDPFHRGSLEENRKFIFNQYTQLGVIMHNKIFCP